MLHRPLRLLPALLAAAVVAPLVVSLATPATAGPSIRRIAGTDRYSTAVAVSRSAHPGTAPVAVVTTGATFPDALAGGPAAAKLGGPVLLVARDKAPQVVLDELRRLQPQRVLVLGGQGAVSDTATAQISAQGHPVTRIAGTGRYETAALISREAFSPIVDVAYVATGTDYPDALAGAAAASAAGAPVLLTARDELPGATALELRRLLPKKLVILGGVGAVSTAVEQQLAAYAPSVTRIAGPDRYATAAAIARSSSTPPTGFFLATGQGFADALAGGPAAAKANAPVLLVPPTCIPGPAHAEMQRHGYPPLTLLGGSAVLGGRVAELRPCLRVPDGELAPGVRLTSLNDPRGPWTGKIITVAPSAAWRLDTALGQDVLPGLETTSSVARRTRALVAINGDFALPGGRPVHAFAKNGRLVQTPQTLGRNVALESRSLRPRLGFPALDVRVDVAYGWSAPVAKVNSGASSLSLTTPHAGSLSPVPGDSCAARLTRTRGLRLDDNGRSVQDYDVQQVHCGPAPLAAAGGDVLTAPLGSPQADRLKALQPGEALSLSWSIGWRDVLDSLGGNPTLMEKGGIIAGNVDGTDSFSRRNPRTAVGYKPDGTLLLITVNGRGADGSVGMSLRELAALFNRLGASDALNLDGGGSTAMVIGGQLQNNPSDGSERPVSSVLLLNSGSGPGTMTTQSTLDPIPPAPLSAEEAAAAEQAIAHDPGSTGGLLGP